MLLLISFAYMHHYMLRGWVSHDEGTLAQTAVRVLRGELPHRDSDDVYTGGLALLNALALRAFGMTLASFRTMLLVFTLVWIVALYYCATRFLRPIAAAITALLAVFWGPPNYFSALPSWYNLFFATFGLAALFRYADVRHRRWLIVAGACGGISILFKITGLYFVVAAGLWIVVVPPSYEIPSHPSREDNGNLRIVVIALALALYGLFLLILAASRWSISYVLVFFLPAALVAFYAGRMAIRDRRQWNLASVPADVAAFVAGVMGPIIAFLIPYLREGGTRTLFHGVFIEPSQRFHFAFLRPVHMQFAPLSLVIVILLVWLLYRHEVTGGKLRSLPGFLSLVGLIIGSALNVTVYRIFWMAVYLSLPFLIVLSAHLAASRDRDHDRRWQAKVLLLALVTAMCALVQFPFSAPIYFCYVAPLGVLLGAALIAAQALSVRWSSFALALALLAYTVWQVGPLFIPNLGWQFNTYDANYAMRNPRAGGIRVQARDGEVYDRIADVIRDHARGEYIFATPDCPEMYFLTNHRNPTRIMYDFFDIRPNRDARLAAMLNRDQINLVVLNSKPEFSNPITPELMTQLVHDYPEHEVVGNFDVRWRP